MRRRPGFSLIELTASLLVAGIIIAILAGLLTRQQRFYRSASELISTRQHVRDALEVLSTDIRGLSPTDTVRLLADSAIELFAMNGRSVVCRILSSRRIGLPATALSGASLSSFSDLPDTGDIALFYIGSAGDGAQWQRYRIEAFAAQSVEHVCPPSSGYTRNSDVEAGAKAFELRLQDTLLQDVHPGSPVMFVRRGRYSLYAAGDGQWHLGYRRCNAIGASVCASIQPISGPYRRYDSNPALTGLLFQYFDASGKPVAAGSATSLARVDVTARSESRHRVLIEGKARTPADSATASFAVRNRLD